MVEIESDESESDEEEGAIYNPKGLPEGWDGKVRKPHPSAVVTCIASLFLSWHGICPIRLTLCH